MHVTYLSFVICFVALAPGLSGAELHAEDTVQKSLQPGSTEVYAVNLKAGDVVSLDFTDTGQDVILTVQTPRGEVARRFSSKLQGGQPVGWYATDSGTWQLALTGRDKEVECGYKIAGLKISKSESLLKPSTEIESPRLKQLGDAAAVAKFWSQVEMEGTPVIEPLPDDPRNMLVTFVWRAHGETKGGMVQGQFCGEANCFLKLLRDSDLWYTSLKINRHVRTYYSIVPNVSSLLNPTRSIASWARCHNVIRSIRRGGLRGLKIPTCRFIMEYPGWRCPMHRHNHGRTKEGRTSRPGRKAQFRERFAEEYAGFMDLHSSGPFEHGHALCAAIGF